MKKKLVLASLASFASIAVPAMAHEITQTHAHVGEVVLMELPQAAFFALGGLVVVTIAFTVRAKLTKRLKK